MEKITIIGAGSWGSALARILGDNGHQVKLFDLDQKTIDEINTYHTNKSKLPVGNLPETVTGTTDIKEAVDYAHARSKKIYVTLNIVAHNPDFEGLKDFVANQKMSNVGFFAYSSWFIIRYFQLFL